MINETEIFEQYPSAKTILDTIDRIGQSLDYFTERINRVKIVPLSANISAKSATESAKECQVVPLSANISAKSATESAKECQVVPLVPHGTDEVPNDTKRVPIRPICTPKVQLVQSGVQPSATPSANECNLVQKVQTEWERLGISRRTYFRRKSKGLI